jgi:hypothetical protein
MIKLLSLKNKSRISLVALFASVLLSVLTVLPVGHSSALSGYALLRGHASYGPTCRGQVYPGNTCTLPLANAHFIVTNYIGATRQPTVILASFNTNLWGNYSVYIPVANAERQVVVSLDDNSYSFLTPTSPSLVLASTSQSTRLNMFFDTGIR